MQCRVQGHDESYQPDEELLRDMVYESEVTKERKVIVLKSQLMQLFQRCHSCGLEVKFGDFYSRNIAGGKWYMHIQCTTLAIPANNKGYGSWEFSIFCSFSTLWLTFISITNLADVFSLAVFSERYFYSLQKKYLYPVVHINYVRQQEAMIEYLKYTCLGGRCDSPRYST